MKKTLTKNKYNLYHVKDGVKIEGVHSGLRGDISDGLYGNVSGLRGDVYGLRGNVTGLSGDVYGLRGNVSGLRGDISDGLRGNVTGLSGDVSGLRGNVTGLSGNLDDCEITDEDRKKGIDVNELIQE